MISELAIGKTDKCAGDIIANLGNIEKATGESLNDTLKEVGYAMADVAEFDTIIDKASFSVWVGGAEVNDHYSTLAKACAMSSHWINDKKHDDVYVCTKF